MTFLIRILFLAIVTPNQRFLVIESLKSPSGHPSVDFAGLIKIFLHITGPRKMVEGCRLEKEGLFPTGLLEGVLEVSVIWHILLNSLLST